MSQVGIAAYRLICFTGQLKETLHHFREYAALVILARVTVPPPPQTFSGFIAPTSKMFMLVR